MADFDFQVSPEDFPLTVQAGGNTLLVSGASPVREVAGLEHGRDSIRWVYPEEQVSVSVRKVEDYYIPFGEGKRIPSGDPAWQQYLRGQSFPVMEQLSMPFWASASGEYAVLFIMEKPL